MPNFENKGEKEDVIPKKQNLSDREDLNFLAIKDRLLEGVKVRFDQSEKFNSNVGKDKENISIRLGLGGRNDRSLEEVKVRFDQSEKASPNSNNESDLISVGGHSKGLEQKQGYLSKLFTFTPHKKTQNILQRLGYGSSDVSELSCLIEFDPKQARPVQRKFNSKRAQSVPKTSNILEQEVSISKRGDGSKKVPCRIKWRKEQESDKGVTLIGVEGPKITGSRKKKTNTSCSKNEIPKEGLPTDLGVDQESIIARLKEYCLNPTHSEGKKKARVFTSALGITQEDAECFAEQYQFNVDECNSIYEQKDGYGIVAEQYAKMTGVDGKTAWVKIVWMADYEKNADGTCRKECKIPWRLLTSYVETHQNVLSKLEEKGKSE